MKCLLDENVSRSVGDIIRASGCEVLSVRQFVSARAPDHEVYLHVRKQKALFITHDRAFASTRRFSPKQTGGVIVLRLRHQEPDQEAPILDRFFKRHPPESLRGMTVLLYANRVIVRH